MKQISNNDFEMEWENPDFMDTLMGKLPTVRHYHMDNDAASEISSLEQLLSSYNSFISDKRQFIQKVKDGIQSVQIKKPNWYGLNIYEVEECVHQHEFCLISGEGGIGKSYFVKCYEEELEKKDIPHLCIYGKFEEDTCNIDVEEIINASTCGFVFVVDAINEMSETGQNEFIQLLDKLKQQSSVRIVVTYRTNAMGMELLYRYKEIATAEYGFPGVSFESALWTILQLSVPDVYKYEDILYSNNALLLTMLCGALSDTEIINETKNSVASVTFILEHYIKNSIRRIFKGLITCQTTDIWTDTKTVAKWMYEHDEKKITEKSLLSIIKTGENFLAVMFQLGFMSYFDRESERYIFFSIDSLTDFLIARSLFDDIRGKAFKEQADIIKCKVGKLYNLEEAVIIAIFDNIAPDYEHIKKLLIETGLMENFQYETLVKINFKRDMIGKFLAVFAPSNPNNLLVIMGGYTDKPFNCTNYLNKHYAVSDHQRKELSTILSGRFVQGNIKGRLKNILYFITLGDSNDSRVEEALYFALWCCAAPNKDIRCLSMKLLYEVIAKGPEYKKRLIEEYDHLTDDYIKEATIFVLANAYLNDEDTTNFFMGLTEGDMFLTAKSVKRISTYLNDQYGFINWRRLNLFLSQPKESISDYMSETLYKIDLMNKDFLPFRYWGRDHIDMHTKFLKNDKQEISDINKYLEQKYTCVKDGDCNGNLGFKKWIASEISGKNGIDTIDMNSFFGSYETVVRKLFELYQVDTDDKYVINEDFHNSVYMKCVDIATGLFYGSLMCNYYTNEFATYNNYQDSIGYEVYDPIEYGEEVIITSPIPTYQDLIERLGDCVRNRIEVPIEINLDWVRDVSLTRKNVLSLLEVVTIKNVEWVMLASRVSLQEEDNHNTRWKDTYSIWCCTSNTETIIDDGNARYLTIELEDYIGSMIDYNKCATKPWLCKRIKDIAYESDVFDKTSLVLPPAELISFFDLYVNVSDMSWITSYGEKVIICNNNKNSYYSDSIGCTVFIRKNYLDKYLEKRTLMYFAFTERFLPETGYADETSLHLEIRDGKIEVEIFNNGERNSWSPKANLMCEKCPHGYKKQDSEEMKSSLEKLKVLLSKYGMDKHDIYES